MVVTSEAQHQVQQLLCEVTNLSIRTKQNRTILKFTLATERTDKHISFIPLYWRKTGALLLLDFLISAT